MPSVRSDSVRRHRSSQSAAVSTAKVDSPLDLAAASIASASAGTAGEGVRAAEETAGAPRLSIYERIERFISRLSTRNAFWRKACSLIWLPYAFRSGISFRRLDGKRFTAVLPFKRGNRNWYNAMAGAALLGNSEVAAGMYLFSRCGTDYIVVCKDMRYQFLRPCYGPAVYEIVSGDELDERIATREEFNVTLEMEIRQQLRKKGREARVGRCTITFHCTPKWHQRELERQRKGR
jgi:hypothetical protein